MLSAFRRWKNREMAEKNWEDEEWEDEPRDFRTIVFVLAGITVVVLSFLLGRCSSEGTSTDGSGTATPAPTSASGVVSSTVAPVASPQTTQAIATRTTIQGDGVDDTEPQVFFQPEGTASRMLTRVNAERSATGLAPLTWCPSLARSAYNHSRDMAERQYFEHDSPEGDEVSDRAQAEGYDYSFVGENIAVGQESVVEVMDDWMNSPGHRANLLMSSYEHFGLGVFRGPYERQSAIYWTQNFGAGGACE